MFKKILLLSFFPFCALAQPLANDIQEVQLYFGEITSLECCLLISEKTPAPYRGFLLSPYQLVFLKDVIDNWNDELQLQLSHAEDLCDSKLTLCQSNREDLFSQLNSDLSACTDFSNNLSETNQILISDKALLKTALFVSVPVALIFGFYVGAKF